MTNRMPRPPDEYLAAQREVRLKKLEQMHTAIEKILNRHRHDAFISCSCDCWCWEVEEAIDI